MRDSDQPQVTNWDPEEERKEREKARKMALAKRFRKGHDRWLEYLGTKIVGVFHYRVLDDRFERKTPAWTHIHVVALSKGEVHVGVHRTQKNKQYVRKVGYTASLGKALANAVRKMPDFMFDLSELSPKEQATAMYEHLMVSGRFRP